MAVMYNYISSVLLRHREKCWRPNEKFSCNTNIPSDVVLGRGRGECRVEREEEELSDGSCVHSSVFLKKTNQNKTLHVWSPTGSAAKHCNPTNQKSGSNTGGGAGGVFTALPEVHKGEGGAGSGRTGGGLYWTLVTASWMDWAT